LAGAEEGKIFSMFAINTFITPVSSKDGLSWKDNPIDTCTWMMWVGTAILSVKYKITMTDNIDVHLKDIHVIWQYVLHKLLSKLV
jgi:hypothetical protein